MSSEKKKTIEVVSSRRVTRTSSSDVPIVAVVEVSTNSSNGTTSTPKPSRTKKEKGQKTPKTPGSEKKTKKTPGSSHGDAWSTFKRHLQAYYDREQHVDVPQKHREGDYNLGRNLTHVRCNQQYVKNHPERRKWLDDLGFKWKTPRNTKSSQKPWNTFRENLQGFYDREKHVNVPLKHVENGYNLGRNVSNVRSSDQYIMNHPERREWLNSLNFQWELRRKKSEGSAKKKKKSPRKNKSPKISGKKRSSEAVEAVATPVVASAEPPITKRKV